MLTSLSGAESFDAFYRREYGRVLALAVALCGDRGVAEDLVQDAFVAAHQRWSVVEGYDAPDAFVRRLVINRSRSWWRRRGREARALARVGIDERVVAADGAVDDAIFWRAVSTLPAMQARCVALRYVDDLGITAIAAILGCAESTVRVHLHRARTALATRFELEHD